MGKCQCQDAKNYRFLDEMARSIQEEVFGEFPQPRRAISTLARLRNMVSDSEKGSLQKAFDARRSFGRSLESFEQAMGVAPEEAQDLGERARKLGRKHDC